ncbi:methionine ABC transporter permease [Vagococcus vulneris]|uniref:Methionine ABC transporter ATP-binding protein n=1 Tax=Vagococcus vulneris TaxID=1977869 RepID=A0A429ZY13_9ENTE|nr:methionine ABC transporter permease [Vagococcus vulneris]RST98791.1 methionine ABC transporter ATP-binding protein [Vagococcus vulneris]
MTYLETVSYYFPEFLKSLKETGVMLSIATIIGGIFGLVLGLIIYLSRKSGPSSHPFLYQISSGYVNVVRSFPFLLLVVTVIPISRLLFGTAFGAFAASFPLCLVAIAIYARLVEQVLLDVPKAVSDLADSLGCSTYQFIRYFLLVEARSGLVLALTSMLISLVSYSTVMGVVGGGGIGDFAIRYGYQRYEYSVMYSAIVVMIILVGCLQSLGTRLAKRIDKRK